MKNVKWVVTLVTAYAIFFNLTPALGFSEKAIFAFFMLSPFLTGWMVYVILRYGKPSGKTFDEYFYDDWSYRRNNPAKENKEP